MGLARIMCRIGQNHTFVGIYSVYVCVMFVVRTSPAISGDFYAIKMMHAIKMNCMPSI